MESIVPKDKQMRKSINELIEQLTKFRDELDKYEKAETDLKNIVEQEHIEIEENLVVKKIRNEENPDFMKINRKDNFTATNYHDMYDKNVNPEMVI